MPTYPHIEAYYVRRQELMEFGGSDNELNIRPAFQNCLDTYCREHKGKLVLIPELKAPGNVVPDGTVKDTLRMARGYWEAKDTHDDLDAEIQRKFDRGYPKGNIVFEDSETAVLVQNGGVALRVDMSRPGELHRLIRRFLDYELPNIEEFRQAQVQFKTDLPAVLENLRQSVAVAEEGNEAYQSAATAFLDLCRQSISPDVSEADVREMLLQHILTKDIFLRVVDEDQFHRENNVARHLEALERTFFIGDVRREAIDRLRSYYGAIGRAADEIAEYAEKQQFLKAIYEDFYKAYNPAAADRLGELHRLIRRFLDYELPNIEEFRQAQVQFKTDLPAVLENLRQSVAVAEEGNEAYQSAATAFLDLCRQSISPDVSEADVREMLLQHILTKDIFLRVVDEDQFHRENNVVVQPKSNLWSGFVLGHTSSAEFVAYTDATSTGTRMPRTNWADMARYKVALPSIEVSKAFTRLVEPCVNRIVSAIHESHTLAAQRDALLPGLVSGGGGGGGH